MLRLLAFILPLGLDSLAVAAAFGASGTLTARDRRRICALFMVFEGGMPLIGLALGAAISRSLGSVAGYVAAGALIGLGAWMLLSGDDAEDGNANRLAGGRGLALLGIGVSISLDELAIGLSLGLARLPTVLVIAAIAVQAFIAAQLGLRLGAHISERWRGYAGQAAALALIVLGTVLFVQRVTT